jgi:hypothetical protein
LGKTIEVSNTNNIKKRCIVSYVRQKNQGVVCMDDVPEVCPRCGQGNLISEVITDHPNGEHEEIHFYSCGHRNFRSVIPFERTVSACEVGTKLKCGNKVRGKPEQEINDRWDYSDQDYPDRPVINTTYKQRSAEPTVIFHAVMYSTGELKHIDCKKCGNDWKSITGKPLEVQFIVELGDQINICCIQCGASFTRP